MPSVRAACDLRRHPKSMRAHHLRSSSEPRVSSMLIDIYVLGVAMICLFSFGWSVNRSSYLSKSAQTSDLKSASKQAASSEINTFYSESDTSVTIMRLSGSGPDVRLCRDFQNPTSVCQKVSSARRSAGEFRTTLTEDMRESLRDRAARFLRLGFGLITIGST